MATTTLPEIEDLCIIIEQETRVKASIDVAFEALLEQLGPGFEKPDGLPMPFTLEAWPGGRWFRDLGGNDGHWWATVQAIKRPTLLEFSGPLMMSHPVTNNIQYRLSERDGETVIQFHHKGFGNIPEEQKTGKLEGWSYIHDRVRQRAEGK